MGKVIGIGKMEKPDYITERRMPRKDEHESIERYNRQDSLITFRFASFLQESFNRSGCKMRMTAASTALDLFKRKYLDRKIYQEPKEIILDQYKAYYGGRVEVFKRGYFEDLNYYDFNSLYPSVMRERYPDPSSFYSSEHPNRSIIEDYEGISEVDIFCPKDKEIPLIPFRDKTGKLMFPTGLVHGWYSHLELREAVSQGYEILDVQKQYYYTKTFYPFKRYVEDLYKIRKEKKERGDISELVEKLQMNSLYGKFGQKIYGKEKVFHLDSIDSKRLERMNRDGKYTISGDFVYYTETDPEYIPSHVMPIFSLYVTAYGRLKLFNAIKGIDVVYVDTDSIVTHDSLCTSTDLGDLKLEYEVAEAVFVKPKFYGMKTTDGKSIIRVKGNSESYSWNYDRFKEFILAPRVKSMRFSTFKNSNRRNIAYNAIFNMEKEFTLEDDKRVWSAPFDPSVSQSSVALRV
jgi:hypothetical protein